MDRKRLLLIDWAIAVVVVSAWLTSMFIWLIPAEDRVGLPSAVMVPGLLLGPVYIIQRLLFDRELRDGHEASEEIDPF